MSRLNPNAVKSIPQPSVTAPIGVDLIVDGIQRALDDRFAWLERVYPRATRVFENRNGNAYIFPGILLDNANDIQNVLLLDQYTAYAFFYCVGPESVRAGDTFEFNQANVLQRPLHLIVWFDLRRINTTNQPTEEQVKQDLYRCLQNATYTCGVSGIEITNVYDDPADIFADFTFDPQIAQNLTYPTRAFRFELLAVYPNEFYSQDQTLI